MAQKTVEHYDAMTAANPGVENTADSKPYTDEVIRARRRALDQGRLTVLDNVTEQEDPSVPCAGCPCLEPRYAIDVLFPTPVKPLNNDGGYLFQPSQRPQGQFNTLEGSGSLIIHSVRVDQLPGACETDETENCVQDIGCDFTVTLTFLLTLTNDPGQGQPQAPFINLTNPLTGIANPAAMQPVAGHTRITALASGSFLTAEYELETTITQDCDTSTEYEIDFALMNPTPLVGAWSSLASYSPGTLTLSCGGCSGTQHDEE